MKKLCVSERTLQMNPCTSRLITFGRSCEVEEEMVFRMGRWTERESSLNVHIVEKMTSS